MATLTDLYAKCYQAGTIYQDWTALAESGVKMTAGYKWSNNNWVMVIRFRVPKAAKSVSISWRNYANGMTEDQYMRYKVLTAEDPSLNNATSSIAGDGSFVNTKGNYVRNTLTITRNFSPGTYYVYIWTDDSSSNWNAINIRWYSGDDEIIATYEEQESYVVIAPGKTAIPKIKTAAGLVTPYAIVKTPGGWVPYS